MRLFTLALLLTISLSSSAYAQKFGYIDSEFILTKMPEYKQAQTDLNQAAKKWQTELEEIGKEVNALKDAYKVEEVLLTEEMQKERQDSIASKEKKLREKQKAYFGFEGMLFYKKQELIKPVQDKVFDAVEKVAKEKKLQMVFDKSSTLVVIYADPIHDYTDYVLEKLGLGDPEDTIQK
ncbi:MAG: OmpH family outer membrane protein [Cytophagaceae bacterium]|nr:OmpH family outer membrane protein [Cytophagaceae bacterium]